MSSDESTGEPRPTPEPGNPGEADGRASNNNDESKPRRRRRRGGRRNRNRPQGEASANTPLETQSGDSSDSGPAADSPTASRPNSKRRRGGRGREQASEKNAARDSNGKSASSDQTGERSASKPAANAPKPKKKRKPRTKQCVNCYTPCTTIHKVRLDHRKQSVFICDICWPTRCLDNPHYEYEALWVSGRVMRLHAPDKPEASNSSSPPDPEPQASGMTNSRNHDADPASLPTESEPSA